MAVFHQRFSTNTLPQWRLAHPYRYLAHNGEINTVQGNRNWAAARGPLLRSPLLPDLAGGAAAGVAHRLRLAEPRQHARGAADGRPRSAARDAAADSAGLARARYARPGPARLLRVLLAAHGALGRPGRASCSPTAATPCARSIATACGRRASASRATGCLTDRLRDRCVGLRDPRTWCGRASSGPGDMIALDLATGTLLFSADIDQLLKSRHPYKSWLHAGRALPRERPGRRAPRRRAHGPRHAGALPEDVQRHPGGARRHHPRARRGRERGGGLDGRRHADAGAVAPGALALRLLPPAVRAGHQPADRPAARIDRHVAADADRTRVQHLRAGARSTRARSCSARRSSRSASCVRSSRSRRSRTSFIDLQYDPAARASRPRSLRICAAGRERGARGQAGAAAVGPLSGARPHAGARAARDRGGAPPPGEDRAALQVQPAGRDRHRARAASLRLPASATAPPPCIPTWPTRCCSR